MTTEMRRTYLETIRSRYRKSTKKQKSQILNEFCAVCGYERKYAIRILWGHVDPRSRRPGPRRIYSHQVIPHLIYFWSAMNRCCSKKMKAALPLWFPFYREPIDPETKRLLLKMSSATIDRRLRQPRNNAGAASRVWGKEDAVHGITSDGLARRIYLTRPPVARLGAEFKANPNTSPRFGRGGLEDRAPNRPSRVSRACRRCGSKWRARRWTECPGSFRPGSIH